jgi:sugar transferase (PEP-CTERM/EpsH1 system associated)
MKLLFITARFPYPPHKGDQAIPFYRLRHMSKTHEITLLTFYENETELAFMDQISAYCKEIITVKKSTFRSLFNMLAKGLFSSLPLQVLYYRSPAFKRTLKQLLARETFDLIHVYMLRIADYGININRPKVLELIDSMQLNFKRRSEEEKLPLKWLFNMELKRLQHYETTMVRNYDRSIVVADQDREFIGEANVVTIPLGIDRDIFKPKESLAVTERGPVLAFTGNMGYFPNRNALLWFLEYCWQKIKAEVKDTRLVIAGKNPGPEIRKYHDGTSVQVLGFVQSMADIINSARVAIAPMQSGSGMQFKILEAMSCGVPVVSTSLGLGTIPAKDKESVLLGDDADVFTQHCIDLLKDNALTHAIGHKGLTMVQNNFSWQKNVAQLETIYHEIGDNA